MARIKTVISDSWGELVELHIDGEPPGRDGIVHHFVPSQGRPHTVLVTADESRSIRRVLVNGQEATPIAVRDHIMFVAELKAGERANIEIILDRETSSTTVRAGFFARMGQRMQGMVHAALAKLQDKCFVCRMLFRAGLSTITSGADVVGEGAAAALDAVQDALEDYINDTILNEILDVLKNAANPGRLVAGEVCRQLGYCP